MNSGSGQQIKTAYEVHGKTPEFIAEDFKMDVAAVKAYLMQNSSVYRKECSKESGEVEDPTLNFNDDQLRTVNDIIYECATSAQLPDGSPDYRTKLKAAIYLRDDKKKRLDAPKQLQHGPQFNILMLNESIQRARALAEPARKEILDAVEIK